MTKLSMTGAHFFSLRVTNLKPKILPVRDTLVCCKVKLTSQRFFLLLLIPLCLLIAKWVR